MSSPEKNQIKVSEYMEFINKQEREKLVDNFIDKNAEALKELAK